MDFLFESSENGIEEQRKVLTYYNLSIEWKTETSALLEEQITKSKVLVSSDKYAHIITSSLTKTPSQSISIVGSVIGRRVVTDGATVEEVGIGEKVKYGEIFANESRSLFLIQFQRKFNGKERLQSLLKHLHRSSEQEVLVLTAESAHSLEGPVIHQLKTSPLSTSSHFDRAFHNVLLLPVGKIIAQQSIASWVNHATVRQFPLTLLASCFDTDDRSTVFKTYQTILQGVKDWLQVEDILVDIQNDIDLSRHLQAIILAEENSLYL